MNENYSPCGTAPPPLYQVPQQAPVFQRQPAYYGGAIPRYALRPVKDLRVKEAARGMNRMSLVTLIQFAAAIVLEIPLIWIAMFFGVNVYYDDFALLLLETAMVPLSTALPFVLYLVIARQSTVDYLRFEKVGFVNGLLLVLAGLGICLAANYPAFFIQDLMSAGGYEPGQSAMVNTGTVPGFVVELLSTAVLVPIMEELAFRGVIFSRLRRHGKGFAIFATALIFSLVHLDISNVIFAFVAGLVFCFVYQKTGNLWISICIHALNNGIAVFGSNLDLFFQGDLFDQMDSLLMFVPMALGFVALLLLLVFKRDLLFARQAPEPGEPAPLDPAESVLAVVRAPLFWVLAAISALYTLSLFF